MGSGIKAAVDVQIGLESTRGTEVNASRRIIGEARFQRMEELEPFEEQNRGVLSRTARAPVLVRNGMEMELKFPTDFEQILMALLSGVKGGETGAGAGADKTWTITPGVSADPAPDTYTVEFVESDFTTEAEMQALYCFCTGWEIAVGVDGIGEVTVNLVGRKVTDGTKTAAIGLPTLNYASGGLKWAHYIDTTWAGLGGTQITGQIYSFNYRFGPFIFPQYYQDGRADLDFSQYEYGPRTAEIEMDIVHDTAAGKVVVTEEAAKSAGTARFIRNEVVGGTIGGSNYTIQLDGCFYHASDSMQERGTDRDGNLITRMHLLSAYDPTGTQDVKYVVINDIAAFP